MYPELFNFGDFTVHSYGFFIAIGTYLSYIYLSKQLQNSINAKEDDIVKLFFILFFSAFLGGKLFFYLEDLSLYVNQPSKLFQNIGNGFVFYGSLIFVIPAVLLFLKSKKWPFWNVLDHFAIAACIVHVCGRLGCFFAGCCYGIPTELPWGIVYTDPACSANPLGTPLHPTQFYEILMISGIGLFLFYLMKKKTKFQGQLFLIYLVLYSIGRSIVETFRGDEARGFLIDNWLSHSQGISILIIIIVSIVYFMKNRRSTEKE
jgi:phosphatidylglycerol:prolipoprotein diacylglycerol transferase